MKILDIDNTFCYIGLLILLIFLLFRFHNKYQNVLETFNEREKMSCEYSYRKGYLDALNGKKPDFEKSYSDLQKIMKEKDK